jgi:thymidine kinase
MSELHLILGPMFAGKTTTLINKANEISDILNKDKILLINHSSDIRYSENTFITSHDNIKIPCIAMSLLSTIFDLNSDFNISNIKYIFINEGQFFPDLFDIIKVLLFKYQIKIYICGLDGDYKQEPFPNCKLLELIPLSSSVIKLNAICSYCKNKAPFTKRLINSNDIVLIGGVESYQPVCIDHL